MTQHIIHRPVGFWNPVIMKVYETIKAHDGKLTSKDLKKMFGEEETFIALTKLNVYHKIRRTRKLSDHGITWVYKVLE